MANRRFSVRRQFKRNGMVIEREIDVVFYAPQGDWRVAASACEDVRQSLIEHDGYPSDIVVYDTTGRI